ncbi:MAG TPA: FAD-dependent oxidoreductase [Streptosporangiaceae bacterium]|nr:FAD-dependent oxidoreductase [Streptosporangiaceae bacterium]
MKEEITIGDLAARTQHVVGRENDVVRSQLTRNRVMILTGTARLADDHLIEVHDGAGRVCQVSAEKIVIATGTRPARPGSIAFDERTVIDSDGIIHLARVPRSMVVAGAGVIGIEYASMFAALGTKVTVVEQRDRMLEFCDPEVVEALKYHLGDLAVTFRFGERVTAVQAGPDGAVASLASGKRIPADTVMYSAGRRGKTDDLGLAAAGLGPTSGAGSPSTMSSAPPCRTSTPSAMSSASRHSPRHRWSRAAWRRTMPAASRCTPPARCSRSGSTPSPRSASTTLAESDKAAALDATNKMRQIERFSA